MSLRATGVQPIDSPKLIEPRSKAPASGCSLRAAYEGWEKMEPRKRSTQLEFSKGIDRFIELHGDLDVVQINKGHVREFRDGGTAGSKASARKAQESASARACRMDAKAPRHGVHFCGHHQQVADLSSGCAELGAQERCHP